MGTPKLMAMVFATLLLLLTMDGAFAESEKQAGEPEKKVNESEKKTSIMNLPTTVKSKGKTVKKNSLENRADALFNRIDSDKDGKVSHDEYMMPDEVFFKDSDSNSDGFLTKEELQHAWRKSMRNKKYRMMQEQLKEKQESAIGKE